jgi:molybdenum cofactor cytidylyltransferase
MQYGEFKINQAVGIVLCSDITLGDNTYPKGHRLTEEDILQFKLFNRRVVFGARFEAGDIDFNIALYQIAAAICGSNLGYMMHDGVCQISATAEGVFLADMSRVDKFNTFSSQIILNTIMPHSVVKKGDIIARLEMTAPLMQDSAIDEFLLNLSGNVSLLKVSPLEHKQATLIYPHFLNDGIETQHFTQVVTKLITALGGLNVQFSREISTDYTLESLSDALFDSFAGQPDVVFVLNPLATAGVVDLPAVALAQSVDSVVSTSVPLIQVSDMMIAVKGETVVITLPFAYDTMDTASIDGLIKEALFSEKLNQAMFAHQRTGFLPAQTALDEKTQHKVITAEEPADNKPHQASVGVVILAAGQGKRSGTNKLLIEDKNGEPMFMHAVRAALKSKAKPVFLITGHEHLEMEKYVSKLDINVLYNPSYASGIKTSINMGLKAMPSSCDGAILLPADMPYIGADELNRLIAAMDTKADKQLCVCANHGTKSNPILWSKSLYDKADLVPENARMRVVFAEHADYTQTVKIKDAAKLRDITYPLDVSEFCKN